MTDKIITVIDDNSVDDHVDEKIIDCIQNKKSFFMFAGAGSGKTRSLVNALNFVSVEYGKQLFIQQKQVAVITYTNAACDEIMRRVGYNHLFAVSTIHSFLWNIIKPYQKDIKTWIKSNLESNIVELQQKQSKAKTKDYSGDIAKKQSRLAALDNISKFSYNPNGENVGRDSLDHSEVITMGSEFIKNSSTMQKVMISRFPIVFIDESQDTKKELVDALLVVDEKCFDNFIIGMFGDTMQRIYMDGKQNMVAPENWERPAKIMNHRSTKRVIELANAIRYTIDDQQQQARSDKGDGFVRLFIVPNTTEKDAIEQGIYAKMRKITKDMLWTEPNERKTLVLEHSMAANRLGFGTLYSKLKIIGQSYLDGTLIELSFLMKIIFPLVEAKKSDNSFAIMKILRQHSPLLKTQCFSTIADQPQLLQDINKKVNSLVALWKNKKDPLCIDVYRKLNELNLFELPKRIEDILSSQTDVNEKIFALREGLSVPFSELISYWEYVNDKTQFSTHQGVKGLEYDRVAVIMDDESAGGFLFSYEKLFGAKALTDTDKKNESVGKDNALTRTMRLFYVTCTRAKESLALIAYTSDTNAVRNTALSNNWFSDEEIILI